MTHPWTVLRLIEDQAKNALQGDKAGRRCWFACKVMRGRIGLAAFREQVEALTPLILEMHAYSQSLGDPRSIENGWLVGRLPWVLQFHDDLTRLGIAPEWKDLLRTAANIRS